jgi:hypothetical protein
MLFAKFAAALADFELFNAGVLLYAVLALTKWSDSLLATLAVASGIAFATYHTKRANFAEAYKRNATDARAALASCLEGYRIVEVPADFPIGNVTLAQLLGSTGKARVLLLSPKPGYEPLLTFKSFLQPETRAYRSVILLGADINLGVAERFYLIHELCHATVPGHLREFLSNKASYRLLLLYVPIFVVCQHWLAWAALAVLFAYHLLNAKETLGIELDADWNAWRLHEKHFGPEETIRAAKLIAYLFSKNAMFDDGLKPFYEARALQARRVAETLETNDPRFDLYKTAPSLTLSTTIILLFFVQMAATAIGYFDAVQQLPTFMYVFAPAAALVGVIRHERATRAIAKEESLSTFVDKILARGREIEDVMPPS